MVSALRQRAARQSLSGVGDPARRPAGEQPIEFTTPLRANRPPRAAAQPSPALRRWLDWRRAGLGVSIAGAMAASAIGGALVAQASQRGASAAVPSIVAPAASAAHAVAAATAASAAAVAIPAPSAHAASAPATRDGHNAPPAAPSGHAASPAGEPAHGAPPHGSAEQAAPAHTPVQADHTAQAAPEHAVPAGHAAAPAASQPASGPAHAPPPAPALAADLTFGLDLNGDNIPDSLERFVRKTITGPATRVAARRYYRVALPLATRVEQGDTLAHADKQALFRAAECYWLSAAEDAIADPPNLNDRAMLIGVPAAHRMQALSAALQGFDYRVGTDKRQACG